MLTRRHLLIGAPVVLAGAARAQADAGRRPDPMETSFHALCAGLGRGNRLGVAVIDTGSGRRWSYSGDNRFAMCSTFKAPLAGLVLAEAVAGRLRLDEMLTFGAADLLDHAPVVRAHLAAGRLTVAQMCAAAVEESDNSAANLLLRRIGGPAAFTRFARAAGDAATRLDRMEPALNENAPGDPRDTTTPLAVAGLMERLLAGPVLAAPERQRLAGWMIASTRGLDRLRAGFPAGWRVGTKSGTGERGANNDLAVAWPQRAPDRVRPPLIVASFCDAPDHPEARRAATHRAVAQIVSARFG